MDFVSLRIFLHLFILVAVAGVAPGRSLYVDPRNGSDASDGLVAEPAGASGPVATIKRAVALAQPGDVILLIPGASPYYEQVFFADKSGGEGEPIVLDGQGATIDGTVPIQPEEWERVSAGLYKSTVIPEVYCYKANPAYVGRFFFVWEGKINRMGRSLKGPKTPYKKPDELSPGEWTYVEEEKAFYVRVADGIPLEEAPIRVPKIVSGVQITGNCHHLTIRNVKVTHVINDGFALTTGGNKESTVRNIRFENIVAEECGDDGLSAHGDCEVFVDGFFSRANSTGYCSQGVSMNRRVRMEEIHGVEIFPIGGRHEFIDTVVIGHAAQPVTVEVAAPFTTSELIMENCLILAAPGRDPADARMRIQKGGRMKADRLTTQGISIQVAGAVELANSVIAGGPEVTLNILPGADWRGSNLIYDIGLFQIGDQRIAPRDFAAFQSTVGESDSLSQSVEPFDAVRAPEGLPKGIGADYSRLPSASP